jgi:site-specific DNA-methyltransferase (adenine-specific)
MNTNSRLNALLEVPQRLRTNGSSSSCSQSPSTTAKPFYDHDNITIYHHDFIESSPIRPKSVDLIVTSPPYNLDISYGNHNDKLPYKKYQQFTRKWLKQCFRLAKPEGRLCVNVPLDKNKGGQQSVYADITTIAKKAGWKYHCTIVWNEQNISRRTAWGSWKSASAPFIIAPVEMIVVFYKKHWRKTLGSHLNDLTRNEFLEWTNGVWTFSGESKKRVGHPAPFPIELPRRCIKLFSFVGDTIFDPFLGSGTTLMACLQTKRKGVGTDIDKQYCELAKHRILDFMNHPLHLLSETHLNDNSLQELLATNKRSLRPPSTKQIAMALAKACQLPYRGVTKSGRRVHMPSGDQVKLWIGAELNSTAPQLRGADLPTNGQIATVLSKILKMPAQETHNGEFSPISADQIKLWVERHT